MHRSQSPTVHQSSHLYYYQPMINQFADPEEMDKKFCSCELVQTKLLRKSMILDFIFRFLNLKSQSICII